MLSDFFFSRNADGRLGVTLLRFFFVVFHVVANFRRMGVKILEDERLRINGVVKSD